ncbi:MAG: DUF1365 domain-containing protein [Candidatus Obscuribacterales bacterium]|nr:DUF1365 domain-containing protein [Candidatus Obscuribacterales bacterium]
MNSCLYECEIYHSRTQPRMHSFKRKHFMFYLDLDEAQSFDFVLFSRSFFSLYKFEESDHFPIAETESGKLSLKDKIRRFAFENGVEKEIDKIYLLTNLRFLSYVFNPVSFFYCYGKEKDLISCIVEVGNTFAEKKAYLIRFDGADSFKSLQKKNFYVSPFTELDQYFAFDIGMPCQEMRIRIDTVAGSASALDLEKSTSGKPPVLSAVMNCRRNPLSDRELLRFTLRYPFSTFFVIFLIHYHALLLFLKKVPHRRKEENPEQQSDLMNPHISLKYREAPYLTKHKV